MPSMRSARWTLARPPKGMARLADFRLERFDVHEPRDGELLVNIRYHTVAPGVLAKLSGATYTAQVRPGDVIPGFAVGLVEASAAVGYVAGDIVVGDLGWATHAIVPATKVERLGASMFENSSVPLSAAVGLLGASGLAAFFGLTRVGNVRPGESVLVSSAFGAVGSAVGQFGRAIGCEMIGIAGSQEKCAALVARGGYKRAVAHTDTRFKDELATLLPQGADLYFDNVGGAVSDAAFDRLVLHGRVVLCGQTSSYGGRSAGNSKGMTVAITRRLTLRGFVVHDYADEFGAARQMIATWMREGRIRDDTEVVAGIESAPTLFLRQFEGSAPRAIISPGPD
ncbi:MAG: NADP-dependent oxidoreductase [Sphingomonadales bacterium]|nr:MAG: NADP-dependent oxidoreductase [Sphingomonadales bacterium]